MLYLQNAPGAQFAEPLNATNSKASFQQSIDEHDLNINPYEDLECELETEILQAHYRNSPLLCLFLLGYMSTDFFLTNEEDINAINRITGQSVAISESRKQNNGLNESKVKRSMYLAVRMKTGMNDAVHVQVQVVELHAIRIRFRNINSAVAAGGVLLHNVDDRERVPIREPPVKRWHSHISGSLRPGSETRERGKKLL